MDDGGGCKDVRGRLLYVSIQIWFWGRGLSSFIFLSLDLQPMNREMVPMSEILVSDERENGWVIERGTIRISSGA
jgi:hypothetical protein